MDAEGWALSVVDEEGDASWAISLALSGWLSIEVLTIRIKSQEPILLLLVG